MGLWVCVPREASDLLILSAQSCKGLNSLLYKQPRISRDIQTAKALNRLPRCAGWSKPLLGAHTWRHYSAVHLYLCDICFEFLWDCIAWVFSDHPKLYFYFLGLNEWQFWLVFIPSIIPDLERKNVKHMNAWIILKQFPEIHPCESGKNQHTCSRDPVQTRKCHACVHADKDTKILCP